LVPGPLAVSAEPPVLSAAGASVEDDPVKAPGANLDGYRGVDDQLAGGCLLAVETYTAACDKPAGV
jgi:hypothetical protein